MTKKTLGNTGLEVSVLGFGAGHIGSPDMLEGFAGTLLNRAVDKGINFIDTARGYGLSEERIGRHLSWRRGDFVLSTKVGYGVEGVQDWTYDSIVRGTEESLRKMKTGYIDVVLLHSCSGSDLKKDEISRALEDLKNRGLVRFTGYSGENEDLETALGMAVIDVVETSVNLCDQGNLADSLTPQGRFSRLGGRGVIAKRPLANAFWRFKDQPKGNYAEEYWCRWQSLGVKIKKGKDPEFMEETALKFTLSVPQVSTAIVGTSQIENLEKNVSLAESGLLKEAEYEKYRKLWISHCQDFPGQV